MSGLEALILRAALSQVGVLDLLGLMAQIGAAPEVSF